MWESGASVAVAALPNGNARSRDEIVWQRRKKSRFAPLFRRFRICS